MTNEIVFQNLCKSVHDFTKLNPQGSSRDFKLQDPEKAVHSKAPTHLHMLPQSLNELRRSLSNLCKLAHNFRKLTIPRSSTALYPQNPKISSPKNEEHTTTHRQKIQRCCLQQHMPTCATPSSYALTRAGYSHARTRTTHRHVLQRYDVMDDVTTHYGLTNLSRPTQYEPFT